ncbi:MAG: DUF4919 domain-containing protein [bacterium]|nr:DUF4919 domain-containing protein [bacterium]
MKSVREILKMFISIILPALILIIAGCKTDESIVKETAVKKPVGTYSELLERVKKSDRSVDFEQFRISFTKTPNYSNYEINADLKKEMKDNLNKKKYHEAVKIGEQILEKNYVDLDAHMACLISYEQLKNDEKAQFHSYVLNGLMGSILDSGDGVSTKTAYVVICSREEDVILSFLGYKVLEQSCSVERGHHFDVYKVEDVKNKKLHTVYFNSDISVGK